MARITTVSLVDDLNGDAAAETVTFALDGVSYELDLSAENAAKLRDEIGVWAGKARRVGSKGRVSRAKVVTVGGGNRALAQRARAWARDNGVAVSERGRVSASVIDAYLASGK